jgi:hypothetical protein
LVNVSPGELQVKFKEESKAMPERYLKNRSSYLMKVEYRLKTRSRMLGNLHVRYCEGENP